VNTLNFGVGASQPNYESPLFSGTQAFFGSLGNSLANTATGLKNLVTGEASRQLGERAFQITANTNGGKFNGQWGQVAFNIAGQIAGTQSMAEGFAGFDPAANAAVTGQDRVIRVVGGAGQFAGLAAGAAGGVGRLAGPNTFSPLPGSAAVTRMSNSVGSAAARTFGRVDDAAAGGNNGVNWNNGWRTADGKFASPQGSVRPGATAEAMVWDAVEAKPGWQVIRGEVSVRDVTGQLRKYDGAAISPRGRVIGLEVKSGASTRTPAQRTFDTKLNGSGLETLPTVGRNAGLQVRRSIEIRRP
jgi:hypothetical protein